MNLGRTDFYGMVNHVLTQHGKELGVFHVFEIMFKLDVLKNSTILQIEYFGRPYYHNKGTVQ